MIEAREAATAFEALGHESRLAVFRLLIPAGRAGLHAGAIAEALDLAPNRLSFHLNRLMTAGLIASRRQGRHLYYAVRYPMLGDLAAFLSEGCCGDAPTGCLPDCPPSTASASSGRGCRTRQRRDEKETSDAIS